MTPEAYQIKALPKGQRTDMAKLVLAGYRFAFSPSRTPIRGAADGWWNCRDPNGDRMYGRGGRQLTDVIRRVWDTARLHGWGKAS